MGIGLERTNSFNMMVLLKVVLFFFFLNGYFYQMIKLNTYGMYDIKHILNSEGRFIFSNKISSLSVFNFLI